MPATAPDPSSMTVTVAHDESALLARSAAPARTILLATDLTPTSAAATREATELAAVLGARLLIINVVDTRRIGRAGSYERIDQARTERSELLLAIVAGARTSGVDAGFLVWTGDPGESIAAAAAAEGADMVVVGSHGRSRAERIVLGSVSDQVVRTAPCPVLVVRPGDRPV